MASTGYSSHHAYRTDRPGLIMLEEDAREDEVIEGEAVIDDVGYTKRSDEDEEKKMPEQKVFEVPLNEPIAVAWDGPDDPSNPQNFSTRRKCMITLVCCVLTINATFASSATSLTEPFQVRFNVSKEVLDLVTSLFLLGYVMGPIFWGPGSEMFGRRWVLLGAVSLYSLFSWASLATNAQTVLVLRFLTGAFGAAPLIVSGVYWVLFIFAAACTIFSIIVLPETYGPILLTRKAQRLRREDPIGNKNVFSDHERLDSSPHGLLDRIFYRPWKMMASEPILVLITIYMSVVYGILYALLDVFPVVFAITRGFTQSQLGLVFLTLGIGSTLTTVMNLYFAAQVNKVIPKWKGFPPAEMRLQGAMIGSIMLVVGIFWLGWTGNYASVPWWVPALGAVLVGMGISAIFISLIVYIVDTYLMLAASALASNTMIRSLVGSGFPLFTAQMYHNLGINWASTLIALICLVLAPIPFLFVKYGARIRERSKFAPCLDLKIAKQIREQEEIQSRRTSSRLSTANGTHVDPAQLEEAMEPDSALVNTALLENIQHLTNTMSEVQYLLNEAISSQAVSSQSHQELVDAIHHLRSSFYSRRGSIHSIGQEHYTQAASPGGLMPEAYQLQPLRAPPPTAPHTAKEWSVRLGPIDLSAVTDLHGTALSFSRMTVRGNQISPQVRGRKGGPYILIMSWKTEEEAREFYDAWSEQPPADYATLSVIPSF
ncbi:major facilitator superfamily domain-containing protein [Rhodocollybia butyracea]|uniref:Major facilitator superfamily domain-containing protein n=1 Tax=Rhodocollybia butyracea TaxID=206335 RepID=A0A9P5PVV1_9AGAR|nr:major facilitator superfamily domain-containing protein [Rhodocollybia butyracea]